MGKVTVERASLVDLLTKTQRVAVVGKKKVPQVESCVITEAMGLGGLQTTSIVRDGVSSIAQFFCPALHIAGHISIPVANISEVLGALKAHSGAVTLTHEDDKLRIKSAGKQTTLLSSAQAKAFAHSPKTVQQWSDNSAKRFHASLRNVNDPEPCYFLSGTDEHVTPFISVVVDAASLHSALSASSINGQMVSSYSLDPSSSKFCVTVGDAMKGGKTESEVVVKDWLRNGGAKRAVVGGGLPFCLPSSGEVKVQFYDFSEQGAGVCAVLLFGGSTVFVREAPEV